MRLKHEKMIDRAYKDARDTGMLEPGLVEAGFVYVGVDGGVVTHRCNYADVEFFCMH